MDLVDTGAELTADRTLKTTVVIPVWDRYVGAPLQHALASVTEQGVPVRVLVVDNASEVPIEELGGHIAIRSERRLSLGAARNLALPHLTTPYVVFWDADDVMLPGTLAVLEAALDADPRLAAFGTAIIEEPGGLRHRWPRRWVAALMRLPRLLAVLDCLWSLFPTTGSTIMRAEFVQASGGYADADSGEDWCLGVSLAFRGCIGWSERPGRLYTLHPQSVWARHMTVRHQRSHAAVVRRRIADDPAIPQPVKRATALIWLAQLLAIAAHAALASLRRLSARGESA
jgi:glycosyltransferase involved in cell wall biosynthesis